jgi:sporulation protein YlmC with PRC-barrel domain
MSRRFSFSAMIGLSALIAAPVLAQTMNSPSTPPATRSPAGSAMTSPSTTAPADTRSTATYITADQQVRASKLIGSSVYNDQKQKIGSIDELLVGQNHDVDSAVLSVGGFLGMGSKLVKVPYKELRVSGNEIVMTGATKDQLKQMPDYKFSGPT